MNAKIVMVATLGLVLSRGTLTIIHAQQAFALANTNTGINGGICSTIIHAQQAFALANTNTGINGGICSTNNCNADGRSSNGGNGGQGGNGENDSP